MEINLINDELIIKLPLNNYSNSKNEIIEYFKIFRCDFKY
jgi:hypothetical protein